MSKTELVPGTLILLVLRVLQSGPLHGYAIAQRISQVSGEVLRVEEGSLYPALQKMLMKGWVQAEWGLSDTNRRVRSYRLTAAGRKQLESERAGYDHVNRAIQAVLKLAEGVRRLMKELLRRIWYLWNRRRLEREMAEEMAYHRELMSPDRRTEFRQRPAPARRRARDLGLDLARSPASGPVLRRPRAPQCPRLHPHRHAGSGAGHRRSAHAPFVWCWPTFTGGSAPDPDSLVHLTRRAPGAYMTNLTYPELAFYAANAKSFRNVIGVSERNPGSLRRGRSRRRAREPDPSMSPSPPPTTSPNSASLPRSDAC